MTDERHLGFRAAERGSRSRNRPASHGASRGAKARRGARKVKPERLIPQPLGQTDGALRCQICGCPVDPKRLHIHMVRFHGAALRPGQP